MKWDEEHNKLIKEYKFSNFIEAFSWMTECSFHIEKMNHHPQWNNVYNSVKVELTTHDAGNTITEKDRNLAIVMDKCFEKYSA